MESKLVSKLRPHSNIVQFLGVCTNPLCVLYEYLPKGDLATFVLNPDNKIDEELTRKWVNGIALGMLHLTIEKIVHRDLVSHC